MTRLTNKQLHDNADCCRDRQIFPDRITGADVTAACTSLGITQNGDFNLYDVKEVGLNRPGFRGGSNL